MFRYRGCLSNLIVGAACLASAPAGAVSLLAVPAADGSSLSLSVCAEAAPSLVLYASRSAQDFLQSVAVADGVGSERRGRSLRLAPWPGGCARLGIDLGRITAAARPDQGFRLEQVLLTAAESWLWRPADSAELRFDLPAGWQVSTPYARCGANCFRLGPEAADGPAFIVLGPLDRREIRLPGGVVERVILPGGDAAGRARLDRYAEHSLCLVQVAYGQLPVAHLQMLLVPLPGRQRAVLFGQVYRGGLGGIQVLVDPERPWSEFADNWIAPHEFTHLMHPYLGDDSRWLSEGLASYQQNAILARAGLLSAATAWTKLLQGFDRGRRRDLQATLPEASTHMHRADAYMPVYWGGAGFWLEAELALIEQRQLDLDQLLDRFRACCLPPSEDWNGPRFLAALDRLSESTIFTDTARRYWRQRGFPDLGASLQRLGIALDGKRLSLDPDPAKAALRARLLRAGQRRPC
ncbi:MAG: hypothetical protein AB7K14_09495 [Lysobacterales bacterium]